MMIAFTAATLLMRLLIPGASNLAATLFGSGDRSILTAPSDSNLIPLNSQRQNSDTNEASRIFGQIEAGIVAGDVGGFSRHFGKQTYLSIRNSADAYFRSNQAQYILTDFFEGRRVVSFKLSSLNREERFPYATGGGVIRHRGSNEMFQLYVSLSRAGGRLVISRLNIY